VRALDPLDLFLAAVRAVAPEALSGPAEAAPLASGAQLLDWVTRADPAAASIHARLTDRERADLRQVLDGMLRERAVTRHPR
jgi:hypothetical protein